MSQRVFQLWKSYPCYIPAAVIFIHRCMRQGGCSLKCVQPQARCQSLQGLGCTQQIELSAELASYQSSWGLTSQKPCNSIDLNHVKFKVDVDKREHFRLFGDGFLVVLGPSHGLFLIVLIITCLKTYFTLVFQAVWAVAKMMSVWSSSTSNITYSREQRRMSLSTAWAVANMPRESSWRAGQGNSTPAPFRCWYSPIVLATRCKREVCGLMLPWRVWVLPGPINTNSSEGRVSAPSKRGGWSRPQQWSRAVCHSPAPPRLPYTDRAAAQRAGSSCRLQLLGCMKGSPDEA